MHLLSTTGKEEMMGQAPLKPTNKQKGKNVMEQTLGVMPSHSAGRRASWACKTIVCAKPWAPIIWFLLVLRTGLKQLVLVNLEQIQEVGN